MLLGKGIWPNW